MDEISNRKTSAPVNLHRQEWLLSGDRSRQGDLWELSATTRAANEGEGCSERFRRAQGGFCVDDALCQLLSSICSSRRGMVVWKRYFWMVQ